MSKVLRSTKKELKTLGLIFDLRSTLYGVGMMALKPKVYITRNIPLPALQMLEERCEIKQWKNDMPVTGEVLSEEIKDVDGLFCLLTDKIHSELLAKASKLKVIGTMSVGYDHIDIAECRRRDLKLGYTPEVLTEATAELTVALLLCTARRLIEASDQVRKYGVYKFSSRIALEVAKTGLCIFFSGGWGTWGPMWMLGRGIAGSTVGIVGLGRIGLSVAQKLIPFHPKKIVYYNPVSRPSAADKLGLISVSFDELLRDSDFVLICCQFNEKTKHLFNKEIINKMKKEAVLVNTSRGPVVDQDALYDALACGQIRAAGLDVCTPEPLPTNHKLLTLKNCVILPHIGSATEETRTRMATLTAENILAALEGKEMPAPIPI